ncbi:TetR/AcrR family transcriptional regulator [Blastococcus sp. SYSU D00922]
MSETPDWRARRWAATHQRIYDTALELFQRDGFDGVNVGQIARAADVSVPTFYAHYPSKEHVVMGMPSAEDFTALLAALPAELSVGARFRQAVTVWLGQWSAEFRQDALTRWRIIAASPALRTRAAEFERTAGQVVADAMPGADIRPADVIKINAYMSAYTAGLLAWGDCNGERKLEELMDEAFDALEGS